MRVAEQGIAYNVFLCYTEKMDTGSNIVYENKRALREKIKEMAAGLPESYATAADKKICEAVINTAEYQRAETVFCFVGRKNEIDTKPILEDILRSGKRLCVPKCIAKGIMEARQITSLNDLSLVNFGLLEPRDSCELVLPSEIDFAVVPCVTCDLKGRRLGFGGGYYDRYLSAADFFSCMVCRHKLISEEIPTDSYDIIPDMLITEEFVLYGFL